MEFLEAVKRQVVVLDGAMGTMIQRLNPGPEAFGGESFQMLADLLNFSRAEELAEIHLAYFRAGANGVETNTFGASPLRLKEYNFSQIHSEGFGNLPAGVGLAELPLAKIAYYLNRAGAEVARRALERYRKMDEYDGRPLFVVGAVGPSNHVLSSTDADLVRGTWEGIEENFRIQVEGLLDGGVDVVLLETQQDVLEVKAAVSGAFQAMEKKGRKVPVMVQVTVDEFSRMQIFGTDIHAAIVTLQGIGIDLLGINCSIGPELMGPTVEKLSRYSRLPISVLPNAGMPVSEGGRTVYRLTPEELANHLAAFVADCGVSVVGGCCGTTPDHIRAVADRVRGMVPVARNVDNAEYLSGPQNAVPLDGGGDLLRIGERLNVRGSKMVKEAVEREGAPIDVDVIDAVAAGQVNDLGATVIDVCMDSNEVDTKATMVDVIRAVTRDFPAALCLDSFDGKVLAEAVKHYPGRPVINSISMESVAEGKSKADVLVAATCFHDPLYIALAADDEGPAVTRQGKVAIARRIMETCGRYGVPAKNLMVDINAFPIGSETEEGMNFAAESLGSIPLIKALHPDIRTSIGVSNLTSGLAKKPYMRLVLTSVFLDEARKRGLDAAIVNPGHYVPVSSLDPEHYRLALAVIRQWDMAAYGQLEEISLVRKGAAVRKKSSYDHLEPAEAICEKVKDGHKERAAGTFETFGGEYAYRDRIVLQAAKALETLTPLTLISEYLMVAMKALGQRFAAGEVSLPHLLKSADVMKQVMEFLEFVIGKGQEGAEPVRKGTVILGTIHQDVHSIGKDLTKTLLENYGFRVVDLGVQVSLERFLSAAREENADAIGVSALLVQTANHMITLSEMMRDQGLSIPLLVGGAPVTRRHAAAVAMAGARSGAQETDKDLAVEGTGRENGDRRGHGKGKEDGEEKKKGEGQGGREGSAKEDRKENRDGTQEGCGIKADLFHCVSAMDGVNVMEELQGPNRDTFIAENRARLMKDARLSEKRGERRKTLLATLPDRKISLSGYEPPAGSVGVTRVTIPLSELEIDLPALFGVNWKMGPEKNRELTGEAAEKMAGEWIRRAEENRWILPSGYMGIFDCRSVGEELAIYDPAHGEKELSRLRFDRIVGKDRKDLLALSRCFHSERIDKVGLQIATAGTAFDDAVAAFRAENDLASAHLLQGLANRAAEDMAAMLHRRILAEAGKEPDTGARYSPGYPGLSLHHNKVIAELLPAEKLGVRLTEGFEFIPTSTTAAVVCFHPQAAWG